MLSTLRRGFQQALKKRPLLTNMTVYATFYMAAEISQQTFNKISLPNKPDYNIQSAVRISAVGTTLYAPTLYYWYKFLDKKFVGKAAKTVLTKVACDQFLMTPTLLALFFIVLSVLEQKEDVLEELRHKYKNAFIANQSFWVPVQIINFSMVPSHMRVVYVAACSFLWINVLCHIKRQKIAVTATHED